MRRHRVLLLTVLPALAALPAARMGFTRDDWLMLWAALDPGSAPAGATGAFQRPAAVWLWRLVGTLAGDDPRGLHTAAFLLSLVFALAVAALARATVLPTRASRVALIAAPIAGCHAALMESRLWASGVNGLLAGALAVGGAALGSRVLSPRVTGTMPARHRAGWLLLALASIALGALARADAAVAFVWIAAAAQAGTASRGGRARLALGGSVVVALLLPLLALTTLWGRDLRPVIHLEHAGELLRRLVWPWGKALSVPVARWIGGLGLVGGAIGVWRLRANSMQAASLAILVGIAGAAGTVAWQPAGRYLVMAVAAGSLLLAEQIARALDAGAFRTRWSARILATAVLVWAAAQVATPWMGSSARDLLLRSRAETALYRQVRRSLPALRSAPRIYLSNAPTMGWSSSAADAENVVSTALRRSVRVILVTDGPAARPLMRWDGDHWETILGPERAAPIGLLEQGPTPPRLARENG